MKESKLYEMRNKINTLESYVVTLGLELSRVKTLALGTSQLIKKIPGYEEAIEELKNEATEKPSKEA